MRYLIIALVLLPLAAQAETIRLEPGACDLFTRHTPTPDVDYQPGYDAYGRPVAGADITPPVQLSPTITIPLTVNLSRELGLPMGPARSSEATVGIIRVEGNKAYLNGQPLQPDAEDDLAVLCMKANKHDSRAKAGKTN